MSTYFVPRASCVSLPRTVTAALYIGEGSESGRAYLTVNGTASWNPGRPNQELVLVTASGNKMLFTCQSCY